MAGRLGLTATAAAISAQFLAAEPFKDANFRLSALARDLGHERNCVPIELARNTLKAPEPPVISDHFSDLYHISRTEALHQISQDLVAALNESPWATKYALYLDQQKIAFDAKPGIVLSSAFLVNFELVGHLSIDDRALEEMIALRDAGLEVSEASRIVSLRLIPQTCAALRIDMLMRNFERVNAFPVFFPLAEFRWIGAACMGEMTQCLFKDQRYQAMSQHPIAIIDDLNIAIEDIYRNYPQSLTYPGIADRNKSILTVDRKTIVGELSRDKDYLADLLESSRRLSSDPRFSNGLLRNEAPSPEYLQGRVNALDGAIRNLNDSKKYDQLRHFTAQEMSRLKEELKLGPDGKRLKYD